MLNPPRERVRVEGELQNSDGLRLCSYCTTGNEKGLASEIAAY